MLSPLKTQQWKSFDELGVVQWNIYSQTYTTTTTSPNYSWCVLFITCSLPTPQHQPQKSAVKLANLGRLSCLSAHFQSCPWLQKPFKIGQLKQCRIIKTHVRLLNRQKGQKVNRCIGFTGYIVTVAVCEAENHG